MDELCCELHLFYSFDTEFMVKVIINIKFNAGRRWSESKRYELLVYGALEHTSRFQFFF